MSEEMILYGVSLVPVVSVLVSIAKGWFGLESRFAPLLNVILGSIAVFVYTMVEGDSVFVEALYTTVGIIFGSQVFHETFGHAANVLRDLLGKK